VCLADLSINHLACNSPAELTCDLEDGHPLPHWDEHRQCAWQAQAEQPRSWVTEHAEELHAEHHSGTFVPTLDSCPEHDRADYEDRVREMAARSR